VALSLVLPGLGEAYAGQPRAAAGTFVGYNLIGALGLVLFFAPLGGLVADLPFVAILVAWVLVVARAGRAATRAPLPYVLQPYNRWYWYLGAILAAVVWQLALYRALTTRVIEAFRIPSTAMAPTILSGDYVLVSRFDVDRVPERNELVVISMPGSPGMLNLKRVVGLPGDTVSMTNGVLTRNGVVVAEPFAQLIDSSGAVSEPLHQGRPWHLSHLVATSRRTYEPNVRTWGPLVIPNDSLFVLGDNRDASYDSRFWGAVSVHQVRRRPLVVYLSIGQDGGGFLSIRWNRIGRRF
jgi:signal peptidase I